MTDERAKGSVEPHHLRVVRQGHGANCSSIGSVIDTLFVSSVVGGAIFVAVVAAMKREATGPVRVVGEPRTSGEGSEGDACGPAEGGAP